MKSLHILALAVLLLLLLAQLPGPMIAQAQTTIYEEDFEDAQAQGWDLEPGWQLAQEQGSTTLSGEGHAWARLELTFGSDLLLAFRLKLIHGRIHLIASLSDTARYFIGFDQDGSDLNKQYFPADFQHSLVSSASVHSLERWYLVEIRLQGDRVTLLVDGVQEWSYTDPQPLGEGAIAFETLEGTRAYIDDVRVDSGPGSTPTSNPAVTAAATVTHLPVSSLVWVRTGGPLGGLGYDVRMRPDDPDIMYVTDAKAGVFRSVDGGQTWVPINAGITTRQGNTSDEIPVFCLTIDPNDPDTLWIGTQGQRGVFRSTDGGDTWTRMENGIIERGLTLRGFTVDPHDSSVVYAAGEVPSWEWAGEQRIGREFDLTRGVVYKTTDRGLHWQRIWQGDNLARYIWIDPRDTNVLYVSTGIFDREAANSDVLHGNDGGVGVIKSTDGGATWQQVNNGLRNLYVGSLFMNPDNPDILLAGTGTAWGSSGAGVYLTTDGGATWTQTLSVGLMIESVEFSTSDTQIAYAGGFQTVYRSQDGGHTWVSVAGGELASVEGWGSPGIFAGHPIDFQVDPRNPDRLFSNQYGGGNFVSLDGGRTWAAASKGYTGAAIRDIAVDPTQPGRVIVASRSGIFSSLNGGEDWMGLSFRPFYYLDWHVIAVDPLDPQHLIAGMTCLRNLVNSSDGGLSWRQTQQFPESARKAFSELVFAPSDPDTVYAGSAGFISCGHITSDVPGSGYNATVRMPGAGVFISTDGGEHWRQSPDPQLQDLAISRLAVDPQDANHVFAATFYHGLFHSTDGGQTWSQVGGGLPSDRSISTVNIDPHDPARVFAGRNQAGLYRSMDGGVTWRLLSAGLPAEGVITDVAFDPQSAQVIYASEAFSGVYLSRDGGSIWRQVNAGLSSRSVNTLAISSDGLHLYAASEGSGVYRLDLNGENPPAAPSLTPTPIPTSSATSPPPEAAATEAVGNEPGLCAGAVLLPLALLASLGRKASSRRRAS